MIAKNPETLSAVTSSRRSPAVPFAGDAFSAMENGNARHLFKRFA
jgi:hypothetical protein